jgi:sec-independent protein translocase protein TatA
LAIYVSEEFSKRRYYVMLEGWEWLIIGVVAIVIIMWGPSKIPELAKAFGKAKGEFSKASKEFNDAATTTANAPTATGKIASPPLKSKDEVLLETARNLGIDTDGKTREQKAEEVGIKAKLLSSN